METNICLSVPTTNGTFQFPRCLGEPSVILLLPSPYNRVISILRFVCVCVVCVCVRVRARGGSYILSQISKLLHKILLDFSYSESHTGSFFGCVFHLALSWSSLKLLHLSDSLNASFQYLLSCAHGLLDCGQFFAVSNAVSWFPGLCLNKPIYFKQHVAIFP